MPEIFSNTTLTVNQLIEKIDTGELESAVTCHLQLQELMKL